MSTDALSSSSCPFKLKIVKTYGTCYSIAVPVSECPIILSAQFFTTNGRCVCGIGMNTNKDNYVIYFHSFQGGNSDVKEIGLTANVNIYIIYIDG